MTAYDATPARNASTCLRSSLTAVSTDWDVSSTVCADTRVCRAAPATSLSTVATVCEACAAFVTFCEMWLVAACCSSIEAATPEV